MFGFRPASVLALAAAFLVEAAVHGKPVEVLLFTGRGKSNASDNKWDGWYRLGLSVDSGDGKRPAYDSEHLEALNFSDDSGRWVVYDLDEKYSGRTLLDIVRKCMGEDRVNIKLAIWTDGHCHIGKRQRQHQIEVSETLRIGVGDGQGNAGDAYDWGLFMLQVGNAEGDFGGTNAYCFGSENETNTGHAGQVSITGHVTEKKQEKKQALHAWISMSGDFAETMPGFHDELVRLAAAQLASLFQVEVKADGSIPVGASNFVLDLQILLGVEERLRVEAIINSLRGDGRLDRDFTEPLILQLEDLGYLRGSDVRFKAVLRTAETSETSGQPKAEESSPWPDDDAPEGSPVSVVLVVGSSVFLTSCPFICASLWCFFRQNRQGASGNNSKASKKMNGIEAESDIISMIEEMGDAPCPLAVHDPVCVTLSGSSDTPGDHAASCWRQK